MHKVLGITLCNSLKWGQNTKEIVDKACKRLYVYAMGSKTGWIPPGSPYHHILRPCAIGFIERLLSLE